MKFSAISMCKYVTIVAYLRYVRTKQFKVRFLPRRKHTSSPLQRSVDQWKTITICDWKSL